MSRILSKVFGNLKIFSTQTVLMESESLLSILSGDSQETVSKNIREYLEKHFSKSKFIKVVDFPTDSPWINTTSPLSVHRDLKGKIVLLDFFTYCCINCMHILPDLKILERKYSVEDGLVVIGVHCAKFTNEKETRNIAAAVKRYEVDHAVVNDSGSEVWNSFDVHCWPTLVLLGPNGEILLSLSGEGHLRTLDTVIKVTLEVMKEKNILSSHSLPQISKTEELKSFNLLSYPGKVTSFTNERVRLIGIADTGNHRILITDDCGTIKFTIGGTTSGFCDGDFTSSRFHAPQGLIFKDENIMYVADTENHAIREIDLSTKTVKTVAGTGKQGDDRKGGRLWNDQEISSPWDVCFGRNTNVLFIAMAGHHQIWALCLADEEHLFKKCKRGECKAVAGSGREENRNNCYPHAAAFAQPSGLAYCEQRDSIYIADSESSSIRELNLETGKVNSVVGGDRNPSNLFAFGDRDGVAYDVKLQHTLGVTWHDGEKLLYVADSYNHKLKKVDVLKNTCSTVKVSVELNEPGGVCMLGNKILIADTNNHVIKIYNPESSLISTMSIKSPASSYTEPITSKQIIKFPENGGKLNLRISLNKADDISLTEEAPAFWLINFCDENMQKLPDCEIRGDLKLESNLIIDVPAFSKKPFSIVLINGVMYVCKNDLCSLEKVSFVIDLLRIQNAEDNVTCCFSHTITK